MEPYQERVVAERDDLETKVENLYVFTTTAKFHALTPRGQALLGHQYSVMNEYLFYLNERIKHFPVEEAWAKRSSHE